MGIDQSQGATFHLILVTHHEEGIVNVAEMEFFQHGRKLPSFLLQPHFDWTENEVDEDVGRFVEGMINVSALEHCFDEDVETNCHFVLCAISIQSILQ